ncbi:hypothetical protein M409DRAFT_52226 [Zasmidium cellare ATCC 36951]|uniref:Uncharacterized protein n=1 Tax=Zasmidium cellare ATCC 36951 TaxID=1080233 RepID=A0A6A6CRC7_ZASCE|nr:uncharacterized protein M409DRAFT_52226 [Zasmidium cellare ATCC 36951]KAF2169714.1 hypothetical protein M409DRAFT_52226 [Zasmidium cellare ATCC 36951]
MLLFTPPLLLLVTFLATASAATLTPRHDSSSRTKISYGNYTVPSRSHHNGMLHFRSEAPLAPPCTNCAVTFMQAALAYTGDGRTADAATGMWMHHVVFVNTAREDSVCGGEEKERFFASGNERGAIDFGESEVGGAGYFFEDGDEVMFGGELMNMGEEEVEVEVSVTWGFVQEPEEEGMRRVTPYWLDIGGCGSSEKPAANESYFSYASPTMTSDFAGKIVFIGTHLHDGGEKLEVLRNGQAVCSSVPEYTSEHISSMPFCVDAGDVRKGDEWRVKADYDTYSYAPMVNEDGSLEPVMGIALAYVLKSDDDDVSAPHKRKGRGNGWVIAFFILIALAVMGGVGYVLWNRRRVAVWPRWASGRAREGRYSSLDGPGRAEGEGEGLVGGEEEEDEENVWARQTRGSVRLPGGNGRL